jgi:transposase
MIMSRCRKAPLRSLTPQERQALEHIARSGSEQAEVVARAKEILAVASGGLYQQAAAAAGRRSRDAVRYLVTRFNRDGLAALEPHRRGGRKANYDAAARERILSQARRTPERQQDGTASWSLMTLRRALRHAPDGLPQVSTYTIGRVLHAAGFRWLAARSWCDTGRAVRQRRSGTVTVTIVHLNPEKSITDVVDKKQGEPVLKKAA